MRVLLTGATGFVGRVVRDRLVRRADIELASLCRKPAGGPGTWIAADLAATSGEALTHIREFNPEACIHLSWTGIPDYSEALCTANREASERLVSFLLKETACRQLVLAGSCWEYGKKRGSCVETDSVAPEGAFPRAKVALMRHCESVSKGRAQLAWLRIFFVYGAGQRPGALIPSLIRAVKAGQDFDVRSPLSANDYVHIDDVARGFELALDRAHNGVVNLGSGRSTSNLEVCRLLEREMTGGEARTEKLRQGLQSAPPNTADPIDFWADIGHAAKVLGWKPSISLQDGIGLTVKAMDTP